MFHKVARSCNSMALDAYVWFSSYKEIFNDKLLFLAGR
ncbi:hypothetical protein BN938_2658 [Mucinivorans hirudinis]|uniref:Uncharacterized protein n=1 Tax=Mucinivorans hirudinis TaxID=1433126 RepID=A0A060RE26_9BACT|nr:hypothetical protein BN938_2658 [Mucinivorans hirudinis]